MTLKPPNWRSSLLYAFIGAVVATSIELFIRQPSSGSIDYWNILASTVVGGILGWMYDLARGMQDTLRDSLELLKQAGKALEYQERALRFLLKDKKHTEVLHKLVSDSIQAKFNYIAFVSSTEFLNYLILAVAQSDRFEGTQNKPISWYKENNHKDYLQRVRDRKMIVKRRVFIIADEDKEKMKDDLKNYDVMDYYWSNTGADVQTYWIIEREFRKRYPNFNLSSHDFGIYDSELLITYDDIHLVVTFNVIDNSSDERRFFEMINSYILNEETTPFIKIDPNDLQLLNSQKPTNFPNLPPSNSP